MATVDREQLLEDVKVFLPLSNTLTDEIIRALNESVITKVGDDDTKYAEIRCKCLYACGNMNLTNSLVDSGSIKREKTGMVEVEYHNTYGRFGWQAWLNNLKNVCPLFGYDPTTNSTVAGKTMAIPYDIPPKPIIDCSCDTTNVLTSFTTNEE